MSKEPIKMQLFDLRWKTCFISKKPSGVLSGVSFDIKIHPSDLNGHHLLASDWINNW